MWQDPGTRLQSSPVAALTALGAVGIALLVPITWVQLSALPAPPLPPLTLALLSAVQPFIMVVAAAFAGSFAAPKLGLRSLIVERLQGRRPHAADLRPVLPLAAAAILVGIAINVADELARPLWVPGAAVWPRYEDVWSPVTLVFGLLYGGLTEEIIFRWGLMSGLAWLLWAATGRRRPVAGWIWATAILASTLLFAAGHLPTLSTMIPLSAGPVVRTLGLNGIVGLLFGWIYLRHHLEAAMLCHAAVHVGFAIYALALLAVG